MSRKEPSYYEIALTQRQVVVAFVIVLVCLLASFLLGVWVGQGGGPPKPALEADATADRAAEAAEEDDGKLRFFSEDDQPARTAPEPAEPAAGTPPESPGDDGQEPVPSPTTSLREDLDRGTPPVEPTPQPRQATPPPQERTEPARPVQPAPTRSDLPPGEGFVVQVFSSPDQAQAQKVLERLLAADQDAFLLPQEIEGQVMYRVRVGPFETRTEAERIADRVEREMNLDTWVTQ